MSGRALGLGWLLLLATTAPRATAQATAQATPRAARDLARGVTLSAADIATDSTDVAPHRIVGWVTRRMIRRNEPLQTPAIGPPLLVRAGAGVRIRLLADGFTVARDGTALVAGALGDHVRVRLDGTHSVTGVVAGPALVRIP